MELWGEGGAEVGSPGTETNNKEICECPTLFMHQKSIGRRRKVPVRRIHWIVIDKYDQQLLYIASVLWKEDFVLAQTLTASSLIIFSSMIA